MSFKAKQLRKNNSKAT